MRIGRDKQSIRAARAMLIQIAEGTAMGWKVREMSDEEVVVVAERFINGALEAMPKITEAAQRAGEALAKGAESLARLGPMLQRENP